jgi:formylglycine-generating enzyme required for sulfatase activity
MWVGNLVLFKSVIYMSDNDETKLSKQFNIKTVVGNLNVDNEYNITTVYLTSPELMAKANGTAQDVEALLIELRKFKPADLEAKYRELGVVQDELDNIRREVTVLIPLPTPDTTKLSTLTDRLEQLERKVKEYRNLWFIAGAAGTAIGVPIGITIANNFLTSPGKPLETKAEPEELPKTVKPENIQYIAPGNSQFDLLLSELKNPRTGHKRRRELGDVLDKQGDTRPGVGVDADGIPDIEWCAVTPGGRVSVEIDDKLQTFSVAPFLIAKYPVTFAQYEAFVKARDGFNNLMWWRGMPSEYQRQKLDEQYHKGRNKPWDEVSWYQAVAFCRWLNYRLERTKLTFGSNSNSLVIGQNAEIRLPLEWEWQWAAQGSSEKREYPWGRWQDGYANTYDVNLDQTIAVGMYPPGAAKCGALDMSGQVWEWCANKYSKKWENRSLRGGSFLNDLLFAACAYRFNNYPYYSYGYVGFRVVVSSPVSASDL